jgi:hypothetical protein
MKYLVLALLLSACSGTRPTLEPKPADEVIQAPTAWPNPAWSETLSKALDQSGADLVRLSPCGKPGAMALMVELSRFESNFKPETTYQEEFDDNAGDNVISRGLFQLSVESVNGDRYRCGATVAKLHDPAFNIQCAVKVANALVKENGVLHGGGSKAWLGMARYWSPFRVPAKTSVVIGKAKGACK